MTENVKPDRGDQLMRSPEDVSVSPAYRVRGKWTGSLVIVAFAILLLLPTAGLADGLQLGLPKIRGNELLAKGDGSTGNLIVYTSEPFGLIEGSWGGSVPAQHARFQVLNIVYNPTQAPSVTSTLEQCGRYAVLAQRDPTRWQLGFIWESGAGSTAELSSTTGWLRIVLGSGGVIRCYLLNR